MKTAVNTKPALLYENSAIAEILVNYSEQPKIYSVYQCK